jgi:sterol desaturase/sphingolipid hydroxylase (fatty acid hydroxylase superfamily)
LEALLDAEPSLRLSAFASVLVAMATWELVAPRRVSTQTRSQRWPGNLGMLVVNTMLLRIVFPGVAVGSALLVEARGWGLLTLSPMPDWLKFLAAMLVLDLVIYLQHVLFHAVPALWRLHRVHHTDLDFDVTTGVRFHPAEILLSMLIKCTVIAAFGPPVAAVLLFEVLLNVTSMFNHGNVRIPEALDRVLRCLVVTPDMHRVHHSIVRNETNSNYGFNFPWWDRWFGTYCGQPAAGHTNMTIGIEQFRENGDTRLDRLLLQPLRGSSSVYPINRNPER